jgi:hypothetical protein
MIRMLIGLSIFILLLVSSASASDIRRVVTGLDAGNKAIVLFDSRLSLKAPPEPSSFGSSLENVFLARQIFLQR